MVTPYEDSAMQAIARLGLSAATRYATPMLMQKDTSVVTQIRTTLPCGAGRGAAGIRVELQLGQGVAAPTQRTAILVSDMCDDRANGPQLYMRVALLAAPGRLSVRLVGADSVYRTASAGRRGTHEEIALPEQHWGSLWQVAVGWLERTTRPTIPYKGNVSSTLAKMAITICAQHLNGCHSVNEQAHLASLIRTSAPG